MKPAIKELMDDHQVILRMLGVLRGMCLRLDKDESVAPADLESALDFIKTFADYAHHGKEEDLLFPAMAEAGFPSEGGPVAVMLMEHRMGREFVAALGLAARRLKAGEKGAAQDVSRQASGYAELLVNHIFKEDNILYPLALEALSDAVWQELADKFALIEKERMGPQKRAAYEKLVERLEAVYPAPAMSAAQRPHCG